MSARFQFIEFPSEWGVVLYRLPNLQLKGCFQFIEFPSEWGEYPVTVRVKRPYRFQFIEFPSEWGDFALSINSSHVNTCFQFIEFPSEWGGSTSLERQAGNFLFPIY